MKRFITNTAAISIILVTSIAVSKAQVTEYSYATGNVSGKNYVGGFAGKVSGSMAKVYDCYARGQVTGDAVTGGFAGSNEGFVTNCYSTGKVTASQNAGGFIGISAGTVTNCYWDTQTSAMTTSAGGTGKTTIQLTYQNTKTTLIGFDFTKVWQPDNSPVQNNGYPLLANSKVFQLEVRSYPLGAGTVTNGGYFKSGELADVSAIPTDQYIFKGWKIGNEIISTQLQLTYSMLQNTLLLAIFENKLTGVSEKYVANEIQCILYPNPANNKIKIGLTGSAIPETLSIYSMDGKKWFETSETEIDISFLRNGIYILKCCWKEKTFYAKFIKQ